VEIKEFKKYTNNLHEYSADDVDSFEFMSDDELRVYQDELERYDGGSLSPWDHIRAFITMKKKVAVLLGDKGKYIATMPISHSTGKLVTLHENERVLSKEQMKEIIATINK